MPGFWKTIELYLIFLWDFALNYYQIIIKSVHKKPFYFNHASHLNCSVSQLSGFYIMTHLTLSKLIKFQNDHIFQHNGFINVDKRYLDTFLIKKK